VQQSAAVPLYYAPRKELAASVRNVLQPGDFCVSLGAGDITKLSSEIIPLLQSTP
jgi:UDP-N-acetylmuramate-alanine ligase